MRHEGIKSFYDFRQVTAEELQREASKLIDVSDCHCITVPLIQLLSSGLQGCV